MRPTLPEDSFEERRLPRLIVPSLLLAAAAVLYFFYRKHKFVNGIDTPVVITGGSLRLFSHTPLTDDGYHIPPNGMEISHKKEKNKVVHLTVVDYSSLTWVDYSPLTEADYDSPAIIWLYNEGVEGRCDVEACYTGGAVEDCVRVFTNSKGKKLKIRFKLKGFYQYLAVDDHTRRHPDGNNKLIKVTIDNDGIVSDVTCPSGKCEIRFTYED